MSPLKDYCCSRLRKSSESPPLDYPLTSLVNMALPDYKEISAIARKRRDSSIATYYSVPELDESNLPNNLTTYSFKCGYYTTEELDIIQCEAEHILEKIRDRVWTSVEVTKAFCKASALAQKLVSTARDVFGDVDALPDQLCHRSVVS